MRLRLDQLEALSAIARLGSFRAAARHLNITQPAISGRIRELERQFGLSLVDRSPARGGLTPQGAEVLRYAEQMIALAERLETHFAEPELLSGTVRMGAADTFALTHLSPLLTRIAARYPATKVDLTVDFSASLDRRLHAGDLDIAFLTAPQPEPGIVIEPLLDLELAWLGSPRLGIAERRLTPADLASLPIITNPRPSHLYRTVQEWFAGAGLVPQRLNTCTSLTVMVKLAADGLGLSVLPPGIFRRELAAGMLRRFDTEPPLPPHHMAVAYRTDGGRANLRHILDLARELVVASV